MKRNQLVRALALASLILSLLIGWQQQSAVALSAKNTAESLTKEIQAPEPSKVSPQSAPDANNISPRISFEKTVAEDFVIRISDFSSTRNSQPATRNP